PCAHGTCSRHTQPCERKIGLKAPSWNHRAYSSPVSATGWKKPPTSVPQYGTPDRPVLRPRGSWASSVAKSLLISPDQHVDPNRCMPAAPEPPRRATGEGGEGALPRGAGPPRPGERRGGEAVVGVGGAPPLPRGGVGGGGAPPPPPRPPPPPLLAARARHGPPTTTPPPP